MTIFKHIWKYILSLDFASKIIVALLFAACIAIVVESLYSIYTSYINYSVPSSIFLGLPSYNGPCPEDVSRAYDVFRASAILDDQGATKESYNAVRNKMLSVVQISQFCEDPEAQGRILYIAASIELQGGMHDYRPMKQVIYSIVSLYDQAETIGYNDLHPEESLWLRERIIRNAHHAGIKIILPSPKPAKLDKDPQYEKTN